ncbi:MAG: YggT family protein [Thermoleophilaceae bacterium]
MTLLAAAVTRADVADYVDKLFLVYTILVFIYVLLSFVPRMPYNRFLSAAVGFVNDVVEPYLRLFRRFLPPLKIGPGALDLSPIVGIFVLQIVGNILVGLIRG